jgi:hypothetical protein
MGTAVTERHSGLIGTLKEGVVCGKGAPGVEAIQRPEEARSPLARLVGVAIEGDIDATARLITKLGPLLRCQMDADGAGGVNVPRPRHQGGLWCRD